jgi:hypothetical protein
VFALADTSTICLAYQGNCQPKPRSLALGVADEFGRIDPLILPNPDAP